jgi:predicted dithiol-disulfide oxidoreductase (DUF899 family)
MQLPPIVSPQEWHAAHTALLAREKAATQARDALAAERRRQPMVRFDPSHRFEGAGGAVGLLDLFEGRRQLIVYHFMHTPGAPPCTGCSTFVSNLGHPALLALRDTTMAVVSQKPLTELEALGRRLGWRHPLYSSAGTFEQEAGAGQAGRGFGLSVFLRDGNDVYRTYFTRGRGVEALGTSWELLDITPLGRQEAWEDSPAGHPQGETYVWWSKVDEIDKAPPAPSVVEDGRRAEAGA